MKCAYCHTKMDDFFVRILYNITVVHSRGGCDTSVREDKFCCNDHAFNYMKENLISLGVVPDGEQNNTILST